MNSTSRLFSFRLTKAEMLIFLARNEVISNPCLWHDFPPSLRMVRERDAAGDEVAANFKARLRSEIACQYLLAFRIAAGL
jgi:hypothetical protein